MLIDPRHLHILSAIIDSGSLSNGARSMGKSQPSLSRIVSNLEHRLGEPLFVKGKRPLEPTELGNRLAAEGRTIARATQNAQELASRFITGHTGAIRVAGTPIFMDGVISTVIAGFQDAYSELRVDQSYGYSEELIEATRTGTIDVAICPMEANLVPDDIHFQRILRGRNVIACGPGHPLARKRAFRIEDISEYPWITQPAGSPLYRDLRDVLDSIGASDFKVSYSGGTLSSILNVLAGSNALTVLPYSVVYMQPNSTVQSLPIRIGHPKRELGLMWKNDHDLPRATQRFTRFLIEQFDGISRAITERQRQEIWRN